MEKFRVVMKISAFIVACALLLPGRAYSQRLLFGVKVGGQITTTFRYPAPPVIQEDRVVFGPTIEIRMKHGLSLELDALYKPSVEWSVGPSPFLMIGDGSISTNVSAHSWQFPSLLKWKISSLPLYIGAGLSALNVAATVRTYSINSLAPGSPAAYSLDNQRSQTAWTYGPVMAAGADIPIRSLHIQPELRYIRWQDPPSVGGGATKPDTLQALIGITVEKRSR